MRRVTVTVTERNDPCAAVEVPARNGTRLVAVGRRVTEVSVRKTWLVLEEFTDRRVNGVLVGEEEFRRVERALDEALSRCKPAGEVVRRFSPCPTIATRRYLCPPDAVEQVRRIARSLARARS